MRGRLAHMQRLGKRPFPALSYKYRENSLNPIAAQKCYYLPVPYFRLSEYRENVKNEKVKKCANYLPSSLLYSSRL
jgi:hypothetical protein